MVYLETVALLTVLSLLLYYLLTKNNDYWKKRGIPYAKPLPFVGNLLDNVLNRKSVGTIMTDIYRSFPNEKVCGAFIFNSPALIVRDADMVSQIFSSDYQNFAKNNFPIDEHQDPILGKNMFCQTGESWKKTRQALSPAFTINKIRANYDKFVALTDKFVKYLENHPVVEMKSTFALYTSEVFAATGLGIDGHSFTEEDAILPKLGRGMFASDFVGAVKFLVLIYLPAIAKLLNMRFAPKFVYDYFNCMLRDLIKSRNMEDSKRSDLLQYYIDLRNKRLIQRNADQHEISEDDIIAGVVSFFIESFETSSIVGSLLLQHLVHDQSLQKRLQQEVDDLYSRTDGKPTLEEINDLHLLQKIYLETLRFYPIETLNKVCTKTCELDIGDGRKLKVEKGLSIVLPIKAIHLDSKYWQNGEKFDPDRFSDDDQSAWTKRAFFAFGEGPRVCIGQRQASAALKVAVTKIIRNFDLVPTEKSTPVFVQDPNHFLAAQKGGVHFKLIKRT